MSEVKEYESPGVKVYDFKVLPDEPGFLSQACRREWREFVREGEIVQVNISVSYPGIIGA